MSIRVTTGSAGGARFPVRTLQVQGYLANKKTHPPGTLEQAFAKAPRGGPRRVGVFSWARYPLRTGAS